MLVAGHPTATDSRCYVWPLSENDSLSPSHIHTVARAINAVSDSARFVGHLIRWILQLIASALYYVRSSPGAKGVPMCNHMSPNFDSWSLWGNRRRLKKQNLMPMLPTWVTYCRDQRQIMVFPGPEAWKRLQAARKNHNSSLWKCQAQSGGKFLLYWVPTSWMIQPWLRLSLAVSVSCKGLVYFAAHSWRDLFLLHGFVNRKCHSRCW